MLESPLSLCSTFLKLIQDSYWTYQDILVVQLSVYWINFLKFYQESVMGKGQFMEWRFLLSWFKCSSSQQLLSLSCEQLLVSHELTSRKKDEEIHLFQIIFFLTWFSVHLIYNIRNTDSPSVIIPKPFRKMCAFKNSHWSTRNQEFLMKNKISLNPYDNPLITCW